MLKIGQFALLGQVTTDALRHYDKLGLLAPAQSDPMNGYRYYSLAQLPRLNRLLAMRDMASTVHRVDFQGLYAAKQAIYAWIEGNNYDVVGPLREVYLQFDPDNPANHVTEVQFPVELS